MMLVIASVRPNTFLFDPLELKASSKSKEIIKFQVIIGPIIGAGIDQHHFMC